ncbi:2-C-methyl-D-erythritol 4-phosphate cytidylyltransferase [Ventrimonas sp. CLA-AP-H27]|uniref:2-C-methyl-D-erythritol 4-phosphate cytidylyltransferase n=1 Tax=Ventrimonas faecis TaxID=3133170 RepID=A0ABV1HPT9_9FIRM
MTDTFRIGAVILAGGRGSRMHSDIQKQYMLLDGRPLIAYALEAFERSCADDLVLVTGAGEAEFVQKEILPPLGLTKLRSIVTGGKERYHSVYEGLKALRNCDYVLIHDGARPLVTEAVISRAVQAAVQNDACVVGMPVKDTIKVADAHGFAESTPDRSLLWQVQTPQAFAYPLVRGAYDRLMADETLQKGITDDAMVVEHLSGTKVRLVEGSYENLKVTTPEDLVLAEALLKKRAASDVPL